MEFELWPACVKTHGFRQQLESAAAAGFDSLAIGRLTRRQLQLEDRLTDRDIRHMVNDHGLRLGHYDGFAQWAPYPFADDIPAAAREVFADSIDDCLRMCAELELRSICATGVYDPARVDASRLIDAFGEFCRLAAREGVSVDLECIPMWGIPDLASACHLVDGVRAPNAGLLLDSWHFFRGSADLALLSALPAGSVRTIQLADASPLPPGRDLLEDCLRYRQLPGEGSLPLGEFLDILLDKGGVQSAGPEVFSDQLDALGAVEAAQVSASATRRLLAAASGGETSLTTSPSSTDTINKQDRKELDEC